MTCSKKVNYLLRQYYFSLDNMICSKNMAFMARSVTRTWLAMVRRGLRAPFSNSSSRRNRALRHSPPWLGACILDTSGIAHNFMSLLSTILDFNDVKIGRVRNRIEDRALMTDQIFSTLDDPCRHQTF